MLPRWNAERWTRSLCGLALIALPLLFSPSWYRIRTGKAAALLLIGSLLAGTCLVFLGRTQRPLWRIPPPIRLPLILLAAWEIGGMAWAIDLQIGLRRILLDLILLAYFGAFFALGDRARHRRFFLILNLVAGLTIALFTLYQKTLAPLWLNSLFSPEQSRPTATFGNPNFLSQYLLAVSVLALGWLLFGKRRTLPLICLATACLLAGFQGILLTRSRASTIALTLCAMVLAGLSIYRRFHRNSRASLVYGLMAVVFAANLFWWPRSFLQRFDPEEISNQFRFQAYSDAFNMILQVPWGIGRGQTEVVFSRYRTPTAEIASWTRASQIHCDPLEWTGELGMVPGLFLGLWLGIALLKWMGENLRKSLEPIPWMAASGGILANSLVSFPLHNPSPSLFFAMTMGIAAARPPAPGDCPVSSIRPLRHWIVAGIALAVLMAAQVRYALIPLQVSAMHRKAFTQASPEEARNLFEKAMALEPENHELRYDAGAWYLGQEWTQDAEDLYNLYVVRFPNNPKAWYNLGSAALKNRHSQLARGALERAFELHPLYPPTLSLLGRLELEQGNLPRAEKWFAEVIYLQPKNPQSHYNLAVFHARTGDQAKAIEFCQKAIELNPNYEPARQLLKQLESAP